MTLFEECIKALGKDIQILSPKSTEFYLDELVRKFPITPWARIDWNKIVTKKSIKNLSDIFKWLKKMNIKATRVILLWNYTEEPAIEAELKDVLVSIDDVMAVGPDTFVFCPIGNYVIEFYHDGEVAIGLSNPESET